MNNVPQDPFDTEVKPGPENWVVAILALVFALFIGFIGFYVTLWQVIFAGKSMTDIPWPLAILGVICGLITWFLLTMFSRILGLTKSKRLIHPVFYSAWAFRIYAALLVLCDVVIFQAEYRKGGWSTAFAAIIQPAAITVGLVSTLLIFAKIKSKRDREATKVSRDTKAS